MLDSVRNTQRFTGRENLVFFSFSSVRMASILQCEVGEVGAFQDRLMTTVLFMGNGRACLPPADVAEVAFAVKSRVPLSFGSSMRVCICASSGQSGGDGRIRAREGRKLQ